MFNLMREFNDDPFFSHPMDNMRRMESMMDSMMSPFGMFGGGAHQRDNRGGGALMPFGFGGSLFPMGDMFANINQMGQNPHCHSFSSSSVMTYTTDETGRPQVYQASSSTRTAPGGVKETHQSVQDSRTGVQQLKIGHHLNERGHVVEKKKNRFTGDEEENEELINLEDDDADRFNKEWQDRAQAFNARPMRPMLGGYEQHSSRSPQPEVLAITDGSNVEVKKKSGKSKRKHGGIHKSSHNRPSPYQ